MVFFDRIERAILKPYFGTGLKVSTKRELKKMDETGSDIASGNYINWLIRMELADNNYAVTRDDLLKILEMIG